MRRYSEAVKADVRRRMSPPQRQSVAQISAELGIHVVTLYNWRKAWRLQGEVVPASEKDPEGWGATDKFTVVLETAGLNATELSAYCRERGLYPEQVERWRRRGWRVGFTNGCFDLLHPGHVHLLEQSRSWCDRLVVGLNSDDSVKRLKGPARPIQNEAARAAVLASLATVDCVTVFDEETPLELIRLFQPEVLVKGADYTVETVVGADIVQGYGGQVRLAELLPGNSTTATVARMKG